MCICIRCFFLSFSFYRAVIRPHICFSSFALAFVLFLLLPVLREYLSLCVSLRSHSRSATRSLIESFALCEGSHPYTHLRPEHRSVESRMVVGFFGCVHYVFVHAETFETFWPIRLPFGEHERGYFLYPIDLSAYCSKLLVFCWAEARHMIENVIN